MNLTPEELGKKIKEARERDGITSPEEEPKAADNKAGAGRAMRAGTDLVVAIAVGGFLGYWIDQWLGSKPLFMILLLFVGFGAGFLNIYRSQTGRDYKVGFREENEEEKNKENKEQ